MGLRYPNGLKPYHSHLPQIITPSINQYQPFTMTHDNSRHHHRISNTKFNSLDQLTLRDRWGIPLTNSITHPTIPKNFTTIYLLDHHARLVTVMDKDPDRSSTQGHVDLSQTGHEVHSHPFRNNKCLSILTFIQTICIFITPTSRLRRHR